MRRLALLLIPVALVCAAEKPQPAKRTTKPKPAAAAQAQSVVPPGAVEVEPNLYRHIDTNGKAWLYRKTPFGISKMDESATQELLKAQAAAAASTAKVRATDKGDIVRFERSTPMGSQSWEKKKSELTAEEKGWLEPKTAQVAPSQEK